MSVGIYYVHMCVHSHSGQERVSNMLELELQPALRLLMWALASQLSSPLTQIQLILTVKRLILTPLQIIIRLSRHIIKTLNIQNKEGML